MDKIVVLLFIGFFIIFLFVNSKAPPYINPKDVYDEIVKSEILFPEIVFAQAILETGHFKCQNCSLKDNNIFGFWYKGSYIKYDSWQECVSYYARWQKRHYKGGDYYEFLEKRGYAEDPLYCEKLKTLVNEKL